MSWRAFVKLWAAPVEAHLGNIEGAEETAGMNIIIVDDELVSLTVLKALPTLRLRSYIANRMTPTSSLWIT